MTVQVADLSWQRHAACCGVNPDVFYVALGGSTKIARAICASCEVQSECLAYALANREAFGVWGGTSERERRRFRRRPAAAKEPSVSHQKGAPGVRRPRTLVSAIPLREVLRALIGTRFPSANQLSIYVSGHSELGRPAVARFFGTDRHNVSLEWATIVCKALGIDLSAIYPQARKAAA